MYSEKYMNEYHFLIKLYCKYTNQTFGDIRERS